MAMRRSRSRTAGETPRPLTPSVPTEDDRHATGVDAQAPDRAERSKELQRRIDDIYDRFEADFKYLAER